MFSLPQCNIADKNTALIHYLAYMIRESALTIHTWMLNRKKIWSLLPLKQTMSKELVSELVEKPLPNLVIFVQINCRVSLLFSSDWCTKQTFIRFKILPPFMWQFGLIPSPRLFCPVSSRCPCHQQHNMAADFHSLLSLHAESFHCVWLSCEDFLLPLCIHANARR